MVHIEDSEPIQSHDSGKDIQNNKNIPCVVNLTQIDELKLNIDIFKLTNADHIKSASIMICSE